MKGNNKGFTLVELIVSVAILGIVTLAASGFMIAGSRTYSSLSYTLRLQYESQLIMEQLQEYLVDCSAGAAWDSTEKKLYVANNAASGKTVYVFALDPTGQTIHFQSGTAAADLSGLPAAELMAEHVTGMNVAFSDSKREVTVELTMARNGKTYQAQQVIALRNQPPHGASWSELWEAIKTP